jgi:translation initiation factor IF-2
MKDGRGANISQAGPGQAVVVSGLRSIPAAGDELIVVGSEARAAKMAAARSARAEDFRQGQLARVQAEHSRRQQQLRKQEYERWVRWQSCCCCVVLMCGDDMSLFVRGRG